MQKNLFDWLMVRLASNETIEHWSCGAVDHADTINYRTGKPKPKGLFCESIFWPVKNYECSCWKYKWVRYKGIVCERCGVEVTTSRVRRERMWHVELASPVVHVWYQSSVSGWIHHLLWLSGNEIQKILWFVKYVVVKDITDEQKDDIIDKINEDYKATLTRLDEIFTSELDQVKDWKSKKTLMKDLNARMEENKKDLEKEFNRLKSIISDLSWWATVLESDYRNIFYKFDDVIHFQSWPEAIYYMLKNYDVQGKIKENLEKFRHIKSADLRKKTFALIKLLIHLYSSGVKPENMIIRKLPVIPPDLRPVVQLEWWKFASSDVNTFYRRVLMRNIRLKKMIQVGMPQVVKKNEIRLLQESVNNLLVWEKNTVGKKWAWVKIMKSISDMLSGKEGVFRKNLLWKRVDYSWRSVITVWPDLQLNECGLPLYIAVRMFTPFIIWKLIEKKIVYTPKQAEKLIKDWDPIALKYLDEVIKDKWVLLNRAPTLHRLSIEAFKVRLMPWKTIRLHPLVCTSFNADFDWDQMAVHLPISDEAQREARDLIAAEKNILKPSSWEPTITHGQDMVLWIYYLTDNFVDTVKNIWIFASSEDVIETYLAWDADIKDVVKLKIWDIYEDTTVGRVIFNKVLPLDFPYVNETVWKKKLKNLLSLIFDTHGQVETVRVADQIKNLWFEFATKSWVSMSVLDVTVPEQKDNELKIWDDRVNQVYNAYYKWLLSDEEKHRLVVHVWTWVKEKIEHLVKETVVHWSDLFYMIDSWARWSYNNTTQISWMKWLVLNQQWDIIELPVKGNYIEWLSPIEYYVSTHASRKWKADTALRTAESGYLTRKLCDASQEVIVREHDCQTDKYIIVSRVREESLGTSLADTIFGRVVAEDLYDNSNTIILKKWHMVNKIALEIIEDLDLDHIKVRSALTCQTSSWVCQKCYGMDLATRNEVDLWAPIWIIAAQSIWEPATQLTMRTFHWWWAVASKWADMAQGIDRVKQLFEARAPKNPAIISPFDWVISFSETWRMKFVTIKSDYQKKRYIVRDGYSLAVKKWELVLKWWVYAVKWRSKLKVKQEWVVLWLEKDHIVLWITQEVKRSLTWLSLIRHDEWWKVTKWEILSTWAIDLKEYQQTLGDLAAQKYILEEVKRLYFGQGQTVNDKHIELIIKQLFSKVFIEEVWDSSFIPGTHIKYEDFVKVAKDLESQGKRKPKSRRLVLWLTQIAKETDSWLSAASFQETIRVMVDASLKWSVDTLNDLKSNVIIGSLLPLGEEYRNKHPELAAPIEVDIAE